MRSIALALLMAVTATAALAQPKDALIVDLTGDVATMDPHLQWDTESYTVYATSLTTFTAMSPERSSRRWPPPGAHADDTTIVFDLHTDIIPTAID
jgi:peptide/nickel transport system substrate-binding protein